MSWVPWLLTSLGLLSALAFVVRAAQLSPDPEKLGAVLRKYLAVGNLEVAHKLLVAIGPAPIAVGLRAAVEEARKQKAAGGVAPLDTELVRAFSASFVTGLRRRRRGLAVLGYAFAAGAMWTAHLESSPVPASMLLAWAVTGLGVVWAELKCRAMAAAGPELFAALVPMLRGDTGATSEDAHAYRTAIVDGTSAEPVDDGLRVIVQSPGAAPRSLVLAGAIFKIGTQKSAHLRLEGDPAISRIHAVLERTGEGVTIIDLGSSAGVLFAGEKIAKRQLHHGDSVTLGSTVLTFGIGARPPIPMTAGKKLEEPEEAMHAYGFDERTPDLFFAIARDLARETPAAKGVRIVKLRRAAGKPSYVVALIGEASAVRAARLAIEEKAEERYRKCAAPVEEIAPDVTYGASRNRQLREEMERAGAVEIDRGEA